MRTLAILDSTLFSQCQALFDPSVGGLASVWSTKAFFGNFPAEDSGETIRDVSDRFQVIYADGVGYMYTDPRTHKRIHPIVEPIASGRAPISRLPKDAVDAQFWLPEDCTVVISFWVRPGLTVSQRASLSLQFEVVQQVDCRGFAAQVAQPGGAEANLRRELGAMRTGHACPGTW